jgi:hypothetical protein
MHAIQRSAATQANPRGGSSGYSQYGLAL